MSGWPATSRNSSTPVYPDAPMMPTLTMPPSYTRVHKHAAMIPGLWTMGKRHRVAGLVVHTFESVWCSHGVRGDPQRRVHRAGRRRRFVHAGGAAHDVLRGRARPPAPPGRVEHEAP